MTIEAILTNPTSVELEAAVEENLFDLFRAMVKVLPDSELVEDGKLSYHLSFPSNPMYIGRLNGESVATNMLFTILNSIKSKFSFNSFSKKEIHS